MRRPWEPELHDAVDRDDVPALLAVLDAQATGHAGTAPAAVKRRALTVIRSQAAGRLLQLAAALAASASLTGHELAAILLAERYAEDPAAVTATLLRLADSPSWEVREWAASGCGIALGGQFASFYPAMQAWTTHPSGNVRRAVVLAVMYASAELSPDHAPALLDLLAPLLSDRDAYVKKNLAAFAIGDALLRRYPGTVLPWLAAAADDRDEQVRWNVAQVFVAAAAAPFAAEAEQILARLDLDERTTVRRSVRSARKALAARAAKATHPVTAQPATRQP